MREKRTAQVIYKKCYQFSFPSIVSFILPFFTGDLFCRRPNKNGPRKSKNAEKESRNERRNEKMCLIKRGLESAEVLLHACEFDLIHQHSSVFESSEISEASILLQDTNGFEQKQIFRLLILSYKASERREVSSFVTSIALNT